MFPIRHGDRLESARKGRSQASRTGATIGWPGASTPHKVAAREGRHDIHSLGHLTNARDYARIEAAILYLEEHFRNQPELGEVAEAAGLSPHHFQRRFRHWAGISPKRFGQYLTLDYAKAQLEGSASILDAAYDAGLSGPSRLHDLFVT